MHGGKTRLGEIETECLFLFFLNQRQSPAEAEAIYSRKLRIFFFAYHDRLPPCTPHNFPFLFSFLVVVNIPAHHLDVSEPQVQMSLLIKVESHETQETMSAVDTDFSMPSSVADEGPQVGLLKQVSRPMQLAL